jgi:hypothetical protein
MLAVRGAGTIPCGVGSLRSEGVPPDPVAGATRRCGVTSLAGRQTRRLAPPLGHTLSWLVEHSRQTEQRMSL